MLEFRLALFAVFFALFFSFTLSYIYNIYTSQSFNTYTSRQSSSETKAEPEKVTQRTENESSPLDPTSRDVQNNQCGLILFLHINKCAGGSLAHWFSHCAAGYLKLADMSENYRVIKKI